LNGKPDRTNKSTDTNADIVGHLVSNTNFKAKIMLRYDGGYRCPRVACDLKSLFVED
jgi:hypothetical protein